MTTSTEMRAMIDEYGGEPLEMITPLNFECQSSCWGTCCSQIDILLTPYDVYQMAQHMGKTMKQVIDDHCEVFPGGNSRFPLARFRDAAVGRCEFLAADGKCDARAFRPGVCRSSPIGRVTAMDKQTGAMVQTLIKKLPHPGCQTKNTQPIQDTTAEEWLKANDVQAWWQGSDLYYGVMMWAIKELEFDQWATDNTFSMLVGLLYGCDEFVPAGTPETEMFRRSIEATKHIAAHLAAGFGYGPLKDRAGIHLSAKAAAGVDAILRTGILDEQAIEAKVAEIEQQIRPKGFVVFDHDRPERVREFASFDLQEAQSLLEFLTQSARQFKPLHHWSVMMDPEGHDIQPADELLRRSKMAAIRRANETRKNLMEGRAHRG